MAFFLKYVGVNNGHHSGFPQFTFDFYEAGKLKRRGFAAREMEAAHIAECLKGLRDIMDKKTFDDIDAAMVTARDLYVTYKTQNELTVLPGENFRAQPERFYKNWQMLNKNTGAWFTGACIQPGC